MNFQSSVPVSGISQQSQPAMPTPGTVPAPVPVPVPQSIPSQFGSGSSASSGGGQFGSGTVSGQAAQPNSQFVLSNSAAIRAEIHRFESVHPNIYSIYDLIERIDDLALQNQIREHVISIEVVTRKCSAAARRGSLCLLLPPEEDDSILPTKGWHCSHHRAYFVSPWKSSPNVMTCPGGDDSGCEAGPHIGFFHSPTLTQQSGSTAADHNQLSWSGGVSQQLCTIGSNAMQ
ncbi:unnamed protein product [Pleuronectes platessa]|uniref:Arf-GAP with GTPase, ANK repeat and PH domain-containing protein 3 n=1 Tax=Pleuronectes platessa TaxID=8262 RepID=A0A9N7Z255_PLEPL|nr:unnamed protein product [Pleuronectes platessa]